MSGPVNYQLRTQLPKKIADDCSASVTLCLPNAEDANAIAPSLHGSLAQLPCVNDDIDLTGFDAIVAIPPNENSDGPLLPFTAQALGHFMENEKPFAVCTQTLAALSWGLSDEVGMFKSAFIPDDDDLTSFLNSKLQ